MVMHPFSSKRTPADRRGRDVRCRDVVCVEWDPWSIIEEQTPAWEDDRGYTAPVKGAVGNHVTLLLPAVRGLGLSEGRTRGVPLRDVV